MQTPTQTTEAELVSEQTRLQRIPQQSAVATSSPLSVSQVRSGLQAIHDVMRDCMKDGQDYGKVPGCGDKPGLFQPGAQKLSMMFQLNPEVREEVVTDYEKHHRGFRLVVRVTNGNKFAEGVGECSTLESKYRFRNSAKKCPKCGHESIIKGKAEYGGGWLCFEKKGGCGFKWPDGAKEIESQATGKEEHDNPPDFWNTVRKMAFKRAFVHAIINATNTSELWSQDLEDLAANGVLGSGEPQASQPVRQASQERPQTKSATSRPSRGGQAAPASNAARGGAESGVTTSEMELVDFKEEVKTSKATKKNYTLWSAEFATDSGAQFFAGTIQREIGEKLEALVGMICTVGTKPGKFEGTYEIVSIKEADDVP